MPGMDDIAKPYVVHGRACTLSGAARQIGCTATNIINSAKRHGVSNQAMIDLLVERGAKKPTVYEFDGKVYATRKGVPGADIMSIDTLAEKIGASANTLKINIWKLKSVEAAIEKCISTGRVRRDIPVTWEGVVYPSAKDACSHLGLDYVNVMAYKRRANCSCEDAIRIYLVEKPNTYTIGGQSFATLKEASQHIGWSDDLVRFYSKKENLSYQDTLLKLCKGELPRDPRRLAETYARKFKTAVHYLYLGRDGVERFEVRCPVCGHSVITQRSTLNRFEHSEQFCLEHEV